jgi:hypothetical protein
MPNDSISRPLKCRIQNLDNKDFVEAYFNPKELAIEKQVPWNKHKTSKGNNPVLEFTDAEPKKLSVELLFDTFESRQNVYSQFVEKLESMTLIVDDKKKRPPMCIFLWGKAFSFMGVIEGLSTKYTMFLKDGTPVRATCTVTMKQADSLTTGGEKEGEGEKSKKKGPKPDDYSKEGKSATQSDARRADKFGDDHRATLDANDSEDGTLDAGPVRGR